MEIDEQQPTPFAAERPQEDIIGGQLLEERAKVAERECGILVTSSSAW